MPTEEEDSKESAELERFRRFQKAQENRKEKQRMLLANLKGRKAEFAALLEHFSGWGYEDFIYRFYHQSFKPGFPRFASQIEVMEIH
jgi:hypothetical protein